MAHHTATEHPNAQLVQRTYEAFARGDLDALRSSFTVDAVWHSPGRHPLAGDYVGLEAIVQFLARLMQPPGGATFTPMVQDILASDEHVVVIQHDTGRGNGKHLDTSECVVFTIREGQIADVRSHFFDLYSLDAWWS